MKVNYGNTVPISTVDWHGKVSIVFFLRGCPYRCPYCQNHELLFESNMVEASILEAEMKKSRPFVSSVVFSGGEPLMQKDAVIHLAKYAKKIGLLVGIHTNGHYPHVMAELMGEGLVDKFFIDVKAPLDNAESYAKAIGCRDFTDMHIDPKVAVDKVSRSINLVLNNGIELELRTTIIRDFMGSSDDVHNIARSINELTGRRDVVYVLQQGFADRALLESLRDRKPLVRDELLDLAHVAHEFLDNIYIRTKEKGNEKLNFESI
ncbi:anaerobic ribonucleoside-triphosphate reductase activating protein [Methanolobus sediminis]|uniref:Anaerobic ribonucleoside-triphosphate reductase activating protein n=1 Tax=Methanolobus sediminis TaxID=3072978 RepID=A0AA51UIP8_9EURY|nr:anaerobic ribonucleoside-triphosphate reductase activating protein [Methanolobus sediminis]WMW24219.1 anaerobic ribonucleoside-triphosphate reductase activating protein [Methanolobus sediminis]